MTVTWWTSVTLTELTIPPLGGVKSHFLHALTYDVAESSRFTVDDRVECGTNQLDFHKLESMHSTSDDRVERGTNRVDFVDHQVDIIAICRRTDSNF